MLTRERLGYSGSGDLKYLCQDIAGLQSTLDSRIAAAPDELLSRASEYETEARRLGLRDVISHVLVQRARVLQLAQRHDDAIATLRLAKKELGDLKKPDLRVSIHIRLAEAHAGLGDWHNVSAAAGAGIDLVEAHRTLVNGQYLQSSFLHSSIPLYRFGVEAAYRMQRYELMFARAELAKCRSVLRRRQDNGMGSPTNIERQVQAVRREINEARADGRPEALLAPLRARWRMLWDLLLIERGRSGAEEDIPEFDLKAVKATLAKDEAVLYYYWLDPRRLLVFLIDRRRVFGELVPFGEEREALADLCPRILTPSLDQPESSEQDLERLDSLATFLLPPSIAERLKPTHKRLLISPHHLLHAIPFHALPWGAKHNYLLERFAVTYIPNLRSLLVRYAPRTTPSLLAIGVEDYESREAKTGGSLTRIPLAEAEAEQLGDLYRARGCDVTILKSRAANKSELDSLELSGTLGKFAALHFALHGQNVDSDTPMESHLELFDSGLEGLEIANWRLSADLVVLSACCSGQRPSGGRGMEELPGDDLFGLQAAFFAAGAQRIVCSLWPVQSWIAPPIMTRFHRNLLAGQPPELALQDAIVGYVRDRGLPHLERYYWAPFLLSAVGRAALKGTGHEQRGQV